LDVFIVGTAIGLANPIVALDISASQMHDINWLIGEHYIITDRTVRGDSQWSWTH